MAGSYMWWFSYIHPILDCRTKRARLCQYV